MLQSVRRGPFRYIDSGMIDRLITYSDPGTLNLQEW